MQAIQRAIYSVSEIVMMLGIFWSINTSIKTMEEENQRYNAQYPQSNKSKNIISTSTNKESNSVSSNYFSDDNKRHIISKKGSTTFEHRSNIVSRNLINVDPSHS